MTTENDVRTVIRTIAASIQRSVAALFPPTQAPNVRPKLATRNGYGSETSERPPRRA
jgi:hypothetical protein